jgi:hypothetical protein
MRMIPLLLALPIAAACAAAQPEPSGGEAAAIRELEGRTAGEPQLCVPIETARALTVVRRGTILYGSGRTVWLVRMRDPCPGLSRFDTLIVEPVGSQYCRGDHVRSLDPGSSIPGPICVIESFVPYSRVD